MDYAKHKQIETGLAEFFRSCHSKLYAAKSIIIRPGDTSDTLYYIREGSVAICMENEEGEELIVAYLNQGDFLGEIGLFSEFGDRNITVRARTDCRTEEISYTQIRALATTKFKDCYPMLLTILAEQMASRLLTTTKKASDMAFLDVAGRVESALQELSAQPDAMRHPNGTQLKVTRQEISRMVGCSREMVGRVLRELQDQGRLWAHGKTVIVYHDHYRPQEQLIEQIS